MKYYISDTHFFHENIIRLCNRPFKTVDEMNNTMAEKWNAKVKPDDEVYFLGDFAMKYNNIKNVLDILKSLNGRKYFIRGNHDKCLNDPYFKAQFVWVRDYAEIDDNGRRVILFHYPLEDWNGKFRDSYHLFGHIHNNPIVRTDLQNRFNVGVDTNNFEPKTLDELIMSYYPNCTERNVVIKDKDVAERIKQELASDQLAFVNIKPAEKEELPDNAAEMWTKLV